jgi:hypothetical protein
MQRAIVWLVANRQALTAVAIFLTIYAIVGTMDYDVLCSDPGVTCE